MRSTSSFPNPHSLQRSMYSGSSPVQRAMGMYSQAGVIANASLSARPSRLIGTPIFLHQHLECR